MSEFEARIKTKFGELTVHFTDKPDLEKKLLQVPEFASTIEKIVGPILVKEPEKVIRELEDIYTIGPDGLVKLLKYPKKKATVLKLASFLSHTPLTRDQLKQITGVDNPLAYIGDDFTANPDGTYSLSSEGRAEVANRIIPSLRAQKPAK
jgi:hypothetical protein